MSYYAGCPYKRTWHSLCSWVPDLSIIIHFSTRLLVCMIYAYLGLLGRAKPLLIKHALSIFWAERFHQHYCPARLTESLCVLQLWLSTLVPFLKAHVPCNFKVLILKFILLEREEVGGRRRHQCERETSIGCLLVCAWSRDRTPNPGMCLNGKLSQQPFGLWDDAPTNWATLARALSRSLNVLPWSP